MNIHIYSNEFCASSSNDLAKIAIRQLFHIF